MPLKCVAKNIWMIKWVYRISKVKVLDKLIKVCFQDKFGKEKNSDDRKHVESGGISEDKAKRKRPWFTRY